MRLSRIPEKNPSRRSVLKSIGVGSVLATSSGVAAGRRRATRGRSGRGANSPPGRYDDLEVVDYRVKSRQEARSDLAAARNAEAFQNLATTIGEHTDLAANFDPDSFPSIELITNNPEVNGRQPAIVHIPVEPTSGHIDPNNGGVILALTAGQGNERVPVLALGITRESQNGGVSAQSAGEPVTVTAFGDTGEGMGQIDSAVDSPISTGHSDSDLSAQSFHGSISCFTCTSVIGIACAGAATLSVSSCASAAITAGAFSPWAGGAAAAFCTYIVANAGTLSCAAGTATICAGAGFCEVLD